MNETLNMLQQYIAIAYLRLSKEDARLGESESIENQRSIIREYCQRNNIFLAHEFIDDGCSGLNTDRQGFILAMNALESGQFNMFITKDLSRLSRDHIEADKFIEETFPQLGVRYVAVDDGVDTLKEYDIIVPFKNLFNEMSSRDTSRKVTNAIRVKRDRGEYCTRAPYGYIKDPNDNMHLIPDPRCDWVVKKIFSMYASGERMIDIIRTLDAEGIPTPLELKNWENPGLTRSDRCVSFEKPEDAQKWTRSTIYVMLRNEVYLGHTVLGKTKRVNFKKKKSKRKKREEWHKTLNTHEPLVSQELFDRCQKTKNQSRADGFFKNIFSGFVFCDTCGARMGMARNTTEHNNQPVRGLRCGTNCRYGNKACLSHSIRYDDLCDIVKTRLNYYLSMSFEERKSLVDIIKKRFNATSPNADIEKQIADLEQQNSKTTQAISTLIENNISGLINKKTFESLLEKYNKEIESREKRIASLRENMCEELGDDAFDNFLNDLPYDEPIQELTRDALEAFIERIEVSHYTLPEGRRHRTFDGGNYGQTVKIKYKFLPTIE